MSSRAPSCTINADEIAAALRTHVETFTPSHRAGAGRAGARGRRRHRAGRRPARRPRSTSCSSSRAATLGLALNLDEDSIGAVVLGEADQVEEGHAVKATGRILSVPVGDALIGRVVNALGQPIDGKGPIASERPAPPRGAGARHRRPQARARAAADRHQGHRRHDADRPRPARADHRRPQDRQDHRRHRHDPQPARPGREVHLRRDRPEGLVGRADRRAPSRSTARWSTRSSSTRPRPTKRCSSTSRRTPGARSASTGWTTASTRSSCTTTSRSRPRRTASWRCCCGARRAVRRTPATSSTSTAACSSAPRS